MEINMKEVLVQETLDKLAASKFTSTEDVKEFYRNWMDAIWTYQCPGVMFDYYKKDICIQREEGRYIRGIFAVVKDVAELQAAFPDMTIRMGSMVVTGDEEGYDVWARTYFNGTNLGYSSYGAPTGMKIEGDTGMTLSMLKLEKVDGQWKVVQESTMYSIETLRKALGA